MVNYARVQVETKKKLKSSHGNVHTLDLGISPTLGRTGSGSGSARAEVGISMPSGLRAPSFITYKQIRNEIRCGVKEVKVRSVGHLPLHALL